MGLVRMFYYACDVCSMGQDESFWWKSTATAAAIKDGWKITSKKSICPQCQ